MDQQRVCRLLVIGSQRAPMMKVLSILSQCYHPQFVVPKPNQKLTTTSLPCIDIDSSLVHEDVDSNDVRNNVSKDTQSTSPEFNIELQYIPCIANFGSYHVEENTNNDRSNGQKLNRSIRYLTSMEFYGFDCSMAQSQTLLPFFDTAEIETSTTLDGKDSKDDTLFSYNIIGAIVLGGNGMDETCEKDRTMIMNYIQTMSNQHIVSDNIKWIQASSSYQSMKDEMNAYKKYNVIEKENLTLLRTMGPGKMAHFIYETSYQLIQRRYDEYIQTKQKQNSRYEQPQQPQPQSEPQEKNKLQLSQAASLTESMQIPVLNPLVESSVDNTKATQIAKDPHNSSLHLGQSKDLYTATVNVLKDYYSCRKCRKALFGEDDLQDPPHVPSKHTFSYRKQKHGSVAIALNTTNMTQTHHESSTNHEEDDSNLLGTNSNCQSYFLQQPVDWMTTNHTEGKLNCPHCDTKIGSYHWSGTQCSCGTWIVPAIQIHKSKVDQCYSLPPQEIISDGTRTVTNDNIIGPIHQGLTVAKHSQELINHRFLSIQRIPFIVSPNQTNLPPGTVISPSIQQWKYQQKLRGQHHQLYPTPPSTEMHKA
jgi:dual specificity phosphatase 12